MTDHEALEALLSGLPEVLTPEEVAELLRVDRKAVYRWLDKGELRAYKTDQKWRITRGDLERWLKANSNVPGTSDETNTPKSP